MANDKFKHGWKTGIDGSRTPITEGECADLIAMVEESERKRAAAFPKTLDALRAFLDADQRMKDLGWRKSIFGLEDGAELALAEIGSTGVFRAVWCKSYLHYQGCVASMGKSFIKPIADLTPDERAKMEECEANHAEFMEHQTGRMQALSEIYASDDEGVK